MLIYIWIIRRRKPSFFMLKNNPVTDAIINESKRVTVIKYRLILKNTM